MSTIIFGSTGLCGAGFLKSAEKLDAFSKLITVTRRLPPVAATSTKVQLIVEKDSDKYPTIVKDTKPKICYTSLATTRGAAGSAKAFVDIDYGINIDIAKAAKESGVETFVLISLIGANARSPFLYLKTKGRLEDDVIALKFPRTIILRPGPLLGEREKSKGFLNSAMEIVMAPAYKIGFLRSLWNPIYGDEVGRAAVALASQPLDSQSSEPVVQIVAGGELAKLAVV